MKKLMMAALAAIITLAAAGCGVSASEGGVETAAASTSTMDGSVWTTLKTEDYTYNANILGYESDESAIAAGYRGKTYYFDGEWRDAENASACRFGFDDLGNGTVYTCGNSGHVMKSTDGGKTYAEIADVRDYTPSASRLIDFIDELNGIVASEQTLMITQEGGRTWLELVTPAKLTAIGMTDAELLCFLGDDMKFYTTKDGGAFWDNAPLTLPMGCCYETSVRHAAVIPQGGDSYTLFLIETETGLVKSFSTNDCWKTWVENTLPELKVTDGVFHVSADKTIVTVTDLGKKSITALKLS